VAAVLEGAAMEEAERSATPLAVLEGAAMEEAERQVTRLAVSQAGARSRAVVAAISHGEDTTAADTSMEALVSPLDSMAVHMSTALHIMDTALATAAAITTNGVTGFRVLTATHTENARVSKRFR
jgi:hypothetical protein